MSSKDELQAIALDNFDLIAECGFTKPSVRLVMEDKDSIVKAVSLHSVILKSMAELCQFRDGLETLKVASTLKEHPTLLRDFFVSCPHSLTAGIRYMHLMALN